MSKGDFITIARWASAILIVITMLIICPPMVSAPSTPSVIVGFCLLVGGIAFATASITGSLNNFFARAYDTVRAAFFE